MPLFSSPSEANPICPSAWLPQRCHHSRQGNSSQNATGMGIILHAASFEKKSVYSLYVFSAVGHFVPEKSLLIGGLDATNR